MAGTVRKYNPGFLTDEELVATFCVRVHEYESIVEILRECTGSSNPHQIVIGPRGSGKTSLLLRIAAEVRRDAGLSRAFFPVVFAEESYEVATAGEFWLECLSRLAAQAPPREDGPDLRRSFEDLRTIRDDRTLGDRCLGTLMDYSAREGKRLVLMVENLNMMFRDMADSGDAGWRLRKVLQTEPRIILLASATSRFEAIDHPEHALYDQFRVVALRPLDTNECAVLWEKVAGRCPRPETIRSLEILTGGSPRLLAIVARFGAGLSFRALMADLLDLVDDHTEYFKSHIESLPAQERRVYLALADLWKPATTKEIADRTRLDTNRCSAQLTRLVDRGVVQVAGGSARRKQYYLTERLYNIYYLMRRSRGPDSLIEAIIQFMEAYYSPREMRDIGVRLTREEDLDPAGDTSASTELVALAHAGRGLSLAALDRAAEALAAHGEAARRFGTAEHPALRTMTGHSFLEKADLEHKCGWYAAAIETAGQAIERLAAEPPEAQLRGHLIRVRAALAGGDLSGCEPDVEAILAILPEVGTLPKDVLQALMAFSVAIGPERMRARIRTSPSANLLLPLTTALEREIGIEPRVAREVEEIARDIRRDLAKLRDTAPEDPGGRQSWSGGLAR